MMWKIRLVRHAPIFVQFAPAIIVAALILMAPLGGGWGSCNIGMACKN